MNKILILLSTYNGEKYIEEQINSLLAQNNVELDILIRDDKSTDGTIEFLSGLNNEHIKYYLGENKGAVSSYLDLIESASLDYDFYAFCDQDDVWQVDKLESAVAHIGRLEGPALYYSGQTIVDEKLNIICEHRLNIKRSVYANCIFNQMAGCTAVFNRELLKQLKKYYPEGIYGHDVWCYRVCAAIGGNIFAEETGHILYRQHGNNVVGLQEGLKGKLQRAKKYIFKYNASSYAREIINGYAEQMSKEQYSYFENIKNAPNSLKAKINLLKNNKIIFSDLSLRILFIIKVILGKM